MELVIAQNGKTINSSFADAPVELSNMINLLEEFRQKANMFLTEMIEENGDVSDTDEDVSSSDEDESKQPVNPKKKKMH